MRLTSSRRSTSAGTDDVAWFIKSRVRKDERHIVGTHELQLWLGLMHMAPTLPTEIAIDASSGERFLKLLIATSAPTARGEGVKSQLIEALLTFAARGWRLGP